MNYIEAYPDATVQFSPFAFSNTGVIKSQTVLKLDTYSLVTVPWQFSMTKAILLGSFSLDEISFFQRFRASVASLSLGVQRPDERQPIKVFARCTVSAIGPMKDKKGIALIVLEWKPMPPDLAEILGRYLDLVERLKVEVGDYKDKFIQISPTTAKRLGYNNYAVLRKGGEQAKIALFSLASNRLDFLESMNSPDRLVGEQVVIDLFFLKYRFSVSGTIDSATRLPTGVQRSKLVIGFSAELMHILEEYFNQHGMS
jgi:hypothetical protein